MCEKLITLQESLEILYKYEQKYNVQLNLNMDVGICHIILMINEWEVDGAYWFIEKPFTKEKFIEALDETIKLVISRRINAT